MQKMLKTKTENIELVDISDTDCLSAFEIGSSWLKC